jgi:hypothetical protein
MKKNQLSMMMTAVPKSSQVLIAKPMDLRQRQVCLKKTRKTTEQTSTFLEQHLFNQYSHTEK